MPTASVKQEKQAPPEFPSSIRQCIVIIEHKIRNLEKRKARIESYKDLPKNRKELDKDQIVAIAKYDELIQTLEFARDLSKQFNILENEQIKNRKKQQKKEAQDRSQHELTLIRETLIIQDVLSNMGQENVREDFLQGKTSVTLTPEELQQLDDLYVELEPKKDGSVSFSRPAEHLINLLEGKTKAAFGTTYAALKEKITAISKCGYFDVKDGNVNTEAEETTPSVPEQTSNQVSESEIEHEEVSQPLNQPVLNKVEQQEVSVPEAGQEVPGAFPPALVQEEARPPVADPAYYASSHLSVFKSGPIDFMQENELDTPDVEASTIPTLTYTNQSYTPVDTQTPAPAPEHPEPEPSTPYISQPATEEKDWGGSAASGGGGGVTVSGGGGGDAPSGGEWVEQTNEDNWNTQNEQQSWMQPQNDGFITAGGRGRGGRGRGGGGGNSGERGSKTGSSRGGGGGRGGGVNRGGYNRESNYNREGGFNRDNGYYQNGYRERGERGGSRGGPRGGGSNADRNSGGRGGSGRGGRGGYRGNSGVYRQQQQL